MIELDEYLDAAGRSPFTRWFERLDVVAAAKVTVALTRLSQGNLSSLKGVAAGVFECRIDFGPGYRVYLGRDGDAFMVLLGGGTKKRQDQDIAAAKSRWVDYRRRKRAEGR